MARFYGVVGYSLPTETVPGVWSDGITERAYYGNVLNQSVNTENADKVNDDVRLSSRISLVADAFALGHFSTIKFVEDAGGVCWEVTSVELKRPRLILSLGGVYNGPRAPEA